MSVSDSEHSVKGFIETSFVDWPGRIASVIFLPRCNFRCDWCHNRQLVLHPELLENVPLSHVLERIAALKGWVDGVVVTGGEPTISPGLPDILRRFLSAEIPVKLDTNGSNPEMLAGLLAENLLTGVSMDIKTSLNPVKYQAIAGVPVDIDVIKQSIRIILNSGIWYEFRTTLLPGVHTPDDIADITSWLHDAATESTPEILSGKVRQAGEFSKKSHAGKSKKQHAGEMSNRSQTAGESIKQHAGGLKNKQHAGGLENKQHAGGLENKQHAGGLENKQHAAGESKKQHAGGSSQPLKLQGFKPHPDLPEPWRSMPALDPQEWGIPNHED